ncbi:MAG TPA: DNA cytosine methyltransferase [Nitrococcus sp.]|nr:DNA cytosine methyltransferase [Nitrococcus sp.]
MTLRALDLFCCAGGASMGLYRAGFEVVGVDIRPQPHYPFEFHQADALEYPLHGFDFIWASPPCQKYSWAAKRWREVERADLLDPIRQRLLKQPAPFVIENVVGAPLRRDLFLEGQMFGLRVIKRRHFELHRFWAMQPARPKPGKIGFGPHDFVTVAGHGGNGSARLDNWQDATGIDWMDKREMAEAIPPAYAEFIGRAAIAHIESERAAA